MVERACQDCGHTYASPISICPVCGSKKNLTSEESQKRTRTRETARLGKKPCPKCSTIMRRGFLVEANAPLQVTTFGEGIYWSQGEAGTSRVALRAYACPECGYVEQYIRRLELSKEAILKAPP